MFRPTDDLRIEQIRPLIPPAILMENLPLSEKASTTVAESRRGGRPGAAPAGRPAGRGGRPVLDPRRGRRPRVRARAAGARGRAAGRAGGRDARLLREAAHDRGLEGADQRSPAGRDVPGQRGAEPGAQPAARPGGDGRARRLRVPGHDHAAVHRGRRQLGRDRRADDREPGAPRAGVRACRSRSGSRTAPTATSRLRSTRSRPPATRTISCPSPSRGCRRSSRRAAIRTATSSCAAATRSRTTRRPPSRARWRCWRRRSCRRG